MKIKMLSCLSTAALLLPMSADAQTVVRTNAKPVIVDTAAKEAASQKLPPKVTAAQVLSQPDSTTITTADGRVLTVGEVREQLRSEIADTPSGATETVRALRPTSEIMRAAIADRKKGGVLRPADIAIADRAAFAKACEPSDAARIIRVSGDVSPGSSLAIPGRCFGADRGEVRLVGPFPNGYRILPVNSWADNRVTVQVPAISGLGAVPLRVELVRADRQISNGFEVIFSPQMQEVDVSDLWRGNCIKTARWADVHCNANRGIFVGFYEDDKILIGDAVSYRDFPTNSDWSIEVHSECYLTSASWSGVTRFSGWDQGPHNKAVVQVEGALSDDFHDSGFWTDTRRKSMNMTFGAKAMCPAGVSPKI